MSDVAYSLTDREKRCILDNSIERVINTSMRVALKSRDEDAGINFEDWRELKHLVVKLWDRERNAIFLERNRGSK